MLSLERCRELLGDTEIDEEALRVLRQQLYDLAEVAIAIHDEQEND